jgi:hypothetical protein
MAFPGREGGREGIWKGMGRKRDGKGWREEGGGGSEGEDLRAVI